MLVGPIKNYGCASGLAKTQFICFANNIPSIVHVNNEDIESELIHSALCMTLFGSFRLLPGYAKHHLFSSK
jgi:hypothetical protein